MSNRYGKLIVYSSEKAVFVCRPEDEQELVEDLERWQYKIEEFDRIERVEPPLIELSGRLINS